MDSLGLETRIADLEAEVAYWKSEAQLGADATLVASIASAFGMTPAEAWIVGALWRLPAGRVGRRDRLLEDQPHHRPDSDRYNNIIDVLVHRIRRAMGTDAVETVRGSGFRLTDHGRDLMRQKGFTA